MSQRIRSDAQKFTHDNYATTGAPATKLLPPACTSVFIENRDAVNSIGVSLDGGVTYKTINSVSNISLDVDSLKSYMVKSNSGTPSVECIYASEN